MDRHDAVFRDHRHRPISHDATMNELEQAIARVAGMSNDEFYAACLAIGLPIVYPNNGKWEPEYLTDLRAQQDLRSSIRRSSGGGERRPATSSNPSGSPVEPAGAPAAQIASCNGISRQHGTTNERKS